MKFHPLSLLAALAATVVTLASATHAQTLVRSISGPGANAQFGRACIRIPDQNSDGFADLLIGAPAFNSQRGAIYCVSGAYLALGAGTVTLWSIAPTGNQGDLFGYALAEIPDATGDGVRDFLVGEPGYDTSVANDVGAVRLVDGITHVLLSRRHAIEQGGSFGKAIAAFGASKVVIAAPGPVVTTSRVFVVDASTLVTSGQVSTSTIFGATGSYELGASLAAGPDFDGDGLPEIVAGLPGLGSNAGGIAIYSFGPMGTVFYPSPHAGERLGSSLDAAHDYDGDGVIDIVVGAPKALDVNGMEAGRAVVLSGARLAVGTQPYEIYNLTATVSSLVFDFHFGTAVRASGDLNGDGVGDILVGAPNYSTTLVGFNRGFVTSYSGATGAKFASIFGGHQDYFGDSLTCAFQDLEGDGFKEFVFAGSLADSNGTDSGVVKCYRLFPLAPATYCVGKLNSLGCMPAMSFSGSPKVNSAARFLVTASNIINQKSGLLFYSHAPLSFSFQGAAGTRRSPRVPKFSRSTGRAIRSRRAPRACRTRCVS